MPTWTAEQLDQLGRTDELEISPRRDDGSLRPSTIVWVVRVGDDAYLRSWNGPDGSWYRDAATTGTGLVRVGGDEHEVAFRPATDVARDDIDAAYVDKYGHSRYVDAMVDDGPAATTLRIVPV